MERYLCLQPIPNESRAILPLHLFREWLPTMCPEPLINCPHAAIVSGDCEVRCRRIVSAPSGYLTREASHWRRASQLLPRELDGFGGDTAAARARNLNAPAIAEPLAMRSGQSKNLRR